MVSAHCYNLPSDLVKHPIGCMIRITANGLKPDHAYRLRDESMVIDTCRVHVTVSVNYWSRECSPYPDPPTSSHLVGADIAAMPLATHGLEKKRLGGRRQRREDAAASSVQTITGFHCSVV